MAELPKRHIILAIDHTASSTKETAWAIEHLYKAGDEFHLLYVVPSGEHKVVAMETGLEEVVKDDYRTQSKADNAARAWLMERCVPLLEEKQVPYQLEVVLSEATDNDAVGALLCKRAEQIGARAVVVSKHHNRGGLKEFFSGSVTNYMTHHCKAAVVVLHD